MLGITRINAGQIGPFGFQALHAYCGQVPILPDIGAFQSGIASG